MQLDLGHVLAVISSRAFERSLRALDGALALLQSPLRFVVKLHQRLPKVPLGSRIRLVRPRRRLPRRTHRVDQTPQPPPRGDRRAGCRRLHGGQLPDGTFMRRAFAFAGSLGPFLCRGRIRRRVRAVQREPRAVHPVRQHQGSKVRRLLGHRGRLRLFPFPPPGVGEFDALRRRANLGGEGLDAAVEGRELLLDLGEGEPRGAFEARELLRELE